jgi:hypothetical protein
MSHLTANFLGNSNRYYAFMSEFKGQNRLYVADLENKGEVRWINFLGKTKEQYRQGEYGLLGLHGNVAIVRYNQCNSPSRVYALFFQHLDGNLNDIQVEHVLLDENKLHSKELSEEVRSIRKDIIKLDNGAEAYFLRLSDEKLASSPARGENGKHPMMTIIHGGPFGASP